MMWLDRTSYAQGERRGEVEPRTWKMKLDGLVISVSRHIYHAPDEWVLRCPQVGIDGQALSNKSLPEAQWEAVEVVRSRLQAYLEVLP